MCRLGRRVENPLPQITNHIDFPRKSKGTIGLLNGAKILRIVREIPERYQYQFREHEDRGILADGVLYIQTDKGLIKITSCNNCDLLFVYVAENTFIAFEELDFKTVKETTQSE